MRCLGARTLAVLMMSGLSWGGQARAQDGAEEAPGVPPEPAPDGESPQEPSTAHGSAGEPRAGEQRPDERSDEESGLQLTGRITGEYRHRFVMMSDIPLDPLPRTTTAETGRYGANYFGEQWLRLAGEVRLRPLLRLFGEADLLWGLAYGDTAIGQGPAAWTRQEYGYPGIRLRQLYVELLTPIGLIRVGQQAFSWGLGILSNGGDEAPPFGDYRYGDLVRRILFATKPAGADSPFNVALAADWVAYDLTADYERREDLAFQGVLAAFYEQDGDRVGGYVAYRNQTNRLDDELSIFVADVFARLYFPEPSGGRIRLALELAYVRGTTTLARSAEIPEAEVEQLMMVAQVARVSDELDVILEGGYASGDSNAEDAFQRTATLDPDHRVGLILFPEVLAAMSARSATLASSPETFGRPSRGVELLPTNGGVSGAYYFFPYVTWRPRAWIDVRIGAVVAWTSTDAVDPFKQRARSTNANYRGGDPTRRDLGLELDGAVLLHGPLAEGVQLSGGVEGGVLFPGHAFDDALGDGMPAVGLTRLRLGLRY